MARQHDIRLRRSNTANAIPTDSNLNLGELAINTADGALYFKKSDGTIITGIDNTIMHIDSTNSRVGIGTTSPPQALSVQGRIVELNASGIQVVSIQASSNNGQIQVNSSDGTDRVLLNSSGTSYIRGGNLAIGTNSAASKLTVEGDIRQTTGDLLYAGGGNWNLRHLIDDQSITFDTSTGGTTSEKMRVKGDGKVGIGTSAPDSLLHLKSTGDTRMTIESPDANDAYINFSGASNEMSLGFDKSDAAMYITNHGTLTTNRLVTIKTNGNVGIGLTSPGVPLEVVSNSSAQGIRVRGRSSDDIGQIDLANNSGTARSQLQWDDTFFNIKALAAIPMIFYTNATERMRIQSAGQVGIGTASPGHNLHVVSAGNGEIKAERTSGAAILTQAQASLGRFGTTSNHDLQFMTNSSGRMTITTSGRVGINTTSPADILHIVSSSGDVRQLMDAPTGSDAEIKFAENNVVQYTIGHDAGTGSFVIGTTNVDTQKRLEISDAGVIKFNGAYSFPTSDGSAGQVLKTDGAGNLSFAADSGGGGATDEISDADGDTKIQVEESSDEDIIRFDTAGNETAKFATVSNESVFSIVRRGTPSASGTISFTGTGLITDVPSSGYHSLIVKNGGTEQLRVQSTGKLLIAATSSSFDDKLYINNSMYSTGGFRTGTAATYVGKIYNNSGKLSLEADTDRDIQFGDAGTAAVMYIDNSEEMVGIGTTSPGRKLDVSSGGSDVPQIRASYNSTNYLDLKHNLINAVSSGGNDALQLQTAGTTGLMLDVNQRVGIGTTSPGYRLEVAEDTDGTANLLFLRNSDTTYAQTWAFQSDTSKDLVITGSSGSGGIKLVPGSRGLMVTGNASTTGGLTVGDSSADVLRFVGELKQGSGSGTTVMDSSRRLQNVSAHSYTNFARPAVISSVVNSRLSGSRNDYVANVPFSDAWHDLFAHRRHYTWTYETSTDNSSFSSATINDNIFDHDDETAYEALGSTIKAARWTITDVSFGLGEYISLGVKYTASSPAWNLKVESSTDGSSYTTRLEETVASTNSQTFFYKIDGYGGATHLRITLSKQNISDNNTLKISRLCLWSPRPGDQGKSKSDHYPFNYVRREQINLIDDQKLQLGTSNDLQIYHDGSNSFITEAGTGGLYIRGSNFISLQNAAGSETMIYAAADGAVQLKYDNSTKLATTSGGVTVTGGMTADSLSVDSLSMNGTSIASSGNMTLDVTGDIILDAGGQNIYFDDDGTRFFSISQVSNDVYLGAEAQDKDLIFRVNDGGSAITALTLDASSEGDAIFNNDILLGDGNPIRFGTDQDFRIWFDGNHANIQNTTSNSDIIIKGNDGGSTITALTFDMSEAGKATFGSDVVIDGNLTVSGDSTTLNVATLDVEDKNITLNKGSGDTSASADGAGITVQDAVNSSTDATLLWNASGDNWALSHRLSAPQFIVSDTNAIIYRNSNDLELKTYSGHDINLMPAGNAGIGTTSPITKLDVVRGGATGLSSVNSRTTALFQNNNSAGTTISINAPNTGYSGIFLGDPENEAQGQIKQVHTDNTMQFCTMGGATEMTLKNGKLGIGTTSPTSRLEVHGAVGIIPDTTNSSLQLRDTTALAANNGGSIVFSGIYDSSGSFLGSGPYIKAYKLNATSGNYSYGLKFATRENGVGSQVIGLTITPDQKVGIGTTTPDQKLHVEFSNTDTSFSGGTGGAWGSEGIRIENTSSTSNTMAMLHFRNNDADIHVAGIRQGTDNSDLGFFFEGSEKVRFTNDGKVGIGTSNLTNVFHVNGNARIEGNLMAGGAASSNVPARPIHIKSAGDAAAIRIEDTTSSNLAYDIRSTHGTGLLFVDVTGGATRMTIADDGNVGIGTTDPGQKLEVAGNVKLKGSSSHSINLEPSGSVGNADISFDGTNFALTSNSSSADMVFKTSSSTRMTLHQNGVLDLYSGESSNTFNVGRNANERLIMHVDDQFVTLTADQDSDSNANHSFILDRTFEGSGANNFDIRKDGNMQLRLDTNSYLYLGGVSNAYIHRSGNYLKNQTQHGYIQFGPNNTSFAHIDTDRGEFYFNKGLTVDSGIVRSYNEDLTLKRESTTKATFGSTNTDLTNTRIRVAGALQRTFGNIKVREYHIVSSQGTEAFLLGKIEHNSSTDGAVDAVIKFAHDYGESAVSSSVHFHFAQRSGTARGHWWYEHTDDDSGSDVIKAVLVDDGSGGMFVWVVVGDYAVCHVEATFRQCSSVTDSGTLTAGTLTTGTTLFDTSNNPTSEMHVGSLHGHNDLYLQNKKLILDDDGDTHIQVPFSDMFAFTAGGTAIALLSANVGFAPSNGGSIPLGAASVPWSNIYGNNYYVGSTQIINSSRNLLNIGTISSGAITSTGNVVSGNTATGNNYAELAGTTGSIELCRTVGNPFIDFKSDSTEDFDCRIQQSSNGLVFTTGGQDSTATALTLDSARNATFASLVDIPSKLRHSGDTDNYFSFSATDTQSFVTGNSTRLQITNSLVRFNQENNNQDFAVYSSGSDHMLFVDASADKVGIGTNAPNQALDVQGNIRIPPGQFLRAEDDDGTFRGAIKIAAPSTYNFEHYMASDGSNPAVFIKNSNRNFGIGDGDPLARLHVTQTALSGATATTYAHMIIEDTDAQMDLTSSQSGTWGSAINFKEHNTSNASANDIWSIVRKTTGGDGDSSLNFNFGTGNNHQNTTRQKFHSDGRINATGSIESEGGSLRASSSELLQRRVSGWTVPLQDVIQSRFATNLGDYVYLKAPGNSTAQHGILLVGDNSLYYGRTSIETGGVANSTEAPLDESVAFKITQDGDARFTTRIGIGSFPASNNNSNNNDTTEANRSAPLHIRTAAGGGAGTQVAQVIENYASDYGATPLKLAIDFKGVDSNNASNFARLAQVTVNDTDYGVNNEATSHFIVGMTDAGTYNETHMFHARGHFLMGNSNAFNPTNYVNTGAYFKPDTNGKFLNISGGSHGSFINLMSDTTTDDDQVGGIHWTRTSGQSDAHRQIAGIDVTQATYAPNNLLEGGNMRFFTKPSGGGINTPRMEINSNGTISFFDSSGNADMRWNGSDLILNDDNKLALGNNSEFVLYHTSSGNSIISETGSGSLYLDGSNIYLRKSTASGEAMADFVADGAVTLYHNGSAKLATTSTGVSVTGLLSATTKSFDIEHPTKEGKRLRHGVLEGPEHGVYIRGKHNGHIIELPDYWTGLVDEDSITVQLTAIGKAQELYVENIEDNKVYIASERTIENYFYYIQAERKDVDKIEVEYES